MQPHKIVYYDDPLNDDFAGNDINKKPLPNNFKYVHKNPFYWFGSLLVYWLIAKPILWIVGKIGYGIRIQGKKNLRKIRHEGAFYYGNHTQIADGWLVQCYLSGCKRSYIIADRDAMSIKGVRTLVQMIGCLPVPESPKEHEGFVDAIRYHIAKRHGIVIYPEAHIWPYSTRIRPFTDASFVYPSELGAPVVPFCVTYRKRKFRPNKPPRMTVHVRRPIYPDMSLSLPERKKKLRDAVYDFMLDRATEDENEEWISYLPRKKEKQ